MKRVMVHLVMVCVVFLLFSCMGTTPGPSEPTSYTIDGTVKLWDGSPLADVTIIAGQATTTTDQNGNWRIEGLTGTVLIRAEKDGYYIVVDGTNYYTSIEASNERTINFTAYSETEEFGGGDGTQENPYIIVNVQQLLNMANHVPDSSDSTPLYFTQIRDIDLNDAVVPRNISSDPQPNWTPLGRSDQPYICVYNGSEFSIKNMVVVDDGSLSNGFFHAIENSTIRNVIFENATVVATKTFTNTGILAGSVYSGCTIDNVVVRNSRVIIRVTNADSIGGLVGETYDSTITNCRVDELTIEAEYDDSVGRAIGGFVGSARDSSFRHSSARTMIDGNMCGNIGGFIAVAGTSSFEDCQVEVEMTLAGSTTPTQMGGFVAYPSNCRFVNCDVNATAQIDNREATDVGGFAGYAADGSEFETCYTKITFMIQGSASTCLGGFIGSSHSSSFEGCEVEATLSASSCYNVGGFAGYSAGSSSTRCQVLETTLSIRGITPYLGGMVGYGSVTSLRNCSVEATLTGNYHDSCYPYVGGLFGYSDTSNASDCSFNGSFQLGYKTYAKVGGLVGEAANFSGDSLFEGCTVQGLIDARSSVLGPAYVGGFLGYGVRNPNYGLKFKDCSSVEVEYRVTQGTSRGNWYGYALGVEFENCQPPSN
uniref:Carboxypeptidase regulatory-like domain-containing protein n=1 Tax=Pseudothermotoga hypogea TaxID=57487 RepID=A0A832I628_9THEM